MVFFNLTRAGRLDIHDFGNARIHHGYIHGPAGFE